MVLKPWMYVILAVGFFVFGSIALFHKDNWLCYAVGMIGAIACGWMSFGARRSYRRR